MCSNCTMFVHLCTQKRHFGGEWGLGAGSCVWQAVYRSLVLGGGVLFYSSGLFRMAQRLPHFKLERPAGECTRLSVICTLSNALLSAKLAGLFVCTFPGDFHCLCVIVHMSVNDWCSGSSQDIALIVLLSLACNQGCGGHLWEAECHYQLSVITL